MYTVRAKVLRASSGWKVASKAAYGQNAIKADFRFVFLCVQLKEIEDKILEVLSPSEVNPTLVRSLFPLEGVSFLNFKVQLAQEIGVPRLNA